MPKRYGTVLSFLPKTPKVCGKSSVTFLKKSICVWLKVYDCFGVYPPRGVARE